MESGAVLQDKAANVREVRILLDYRGKLLRLCKLAFTAADASVYLIPYAPNHRFHAGRSLMPEQEASSTFTFTEGEPSDREPKLSIHESGQVHVHAGGRRIGPLQGIPLGELRGQHVATVWCDRFEGLLPFGDKAPSTRGPKRDHVLPVSEGVETGRLIVYVNGAGPRFGGECQFFVTMRRDTLGRPLYVGFAARAEALPEGRKPGVVVLAGWNPRQAPHAEIDYLYVRGE